MPQSCSELDESKSGGGVPQILGLNSVTNGIPDMALAFGPIERAVLKQWPWPTLERISTG